MGHPKETAEEKQQRVTKLIKVKEINNVIRKLRREAASYINDKDRAIVKDYIDNMKDYLSLDLENFQMIQNMYAKRQEDIKNRDKNAAFKIEDVTEKDLKAANVSKKEFIQIKQLVRLDESIFAASEFGTITPQSFMVDVSRYDPNHLNKDVKDILYRPQRVKLLIEKYWQLAKEIRDKSRENTDIKFYRQNMPRFPKKSTEEIQLLDKIFARLEVVMDENQREIAAFQESDEFKQKVQAF